MPRYPNCKCCGCCQGCAPCSCPAASPLVEITINELPTETCFSDTLSLPGSVNVKPCIGCTDKIHEEGYVPFYFKNNTDKCIRIQLLADLSVNGACRINARFNCGGAFTYGVTSGESAWFYVCLGPGAEVYGCMAHYLSGPKSPCCSETGVISNFRYFYGCVDAFGCSDSYICGPEFQAGCPQCFPGEGGGDPYCYPEDEFTSGTPCEDYSTCTDYEIGTEFSFIPCEGCPSGYATYTVASVECREGTCVYHTVFTRCTE